MEESTIVPERQKQLTLDELLDADALVDTYDPSEIFDLLVEWAVDWKLDPYYKLNYFQQVKTAEWFRDHTASMDWYNRAVKWLEENEGKLP